MKTMLLASLIILNSSILLGQAAHAKDGAALYTAKTCQTCHGTDGDTPINPMYPKIAGQSSAYALQQMKDFKSGARSNGLAILMKGILANVSDDEMKILADYLETLGADKKTEESKEETKKD